MSSVITLRGHHVYCLIDYIYWKEIGGKWDPFGRDRFNGYGEEFIKTNRRICEAEYGDPECRVRVVENMPDDLCNGGCKRRKPACVDFSINPEHDRACAREDGVQVNRTYTGRYFIELVKRKYKHMLRPKLANRKIRS